MCTKYRGYCGKKWRQNHFNRIDKVCERKIGNSVSVMILLTLITVGKYKLTLDVILKLSLIYQSLRIQNDPGNYSIYIHLVFNVAASQMIENIQ